MKKSLTYNVLFACIMTCCCSSITAQYSKSPNPADTHQVNKKMENYRFLKNQGYKDKEIFEDLGNANFLNKNYVTALFWYDRLKETNETSSLEINYQKRYDYAFKKVTKSISSENTDNQDWFVQVKSDYNVKRKSSKNILDRPIAERYRELDFERKDGNFIVDDASMAENSLKSLVGETGEDSQYAQVAITPDGSTAYFSKAVYEKPLYGIFSKKELVYKIYKADKVDGEWKDMKEVAVSPKHSSSKHPAISSDGKRLFFASNMPGTFGQYDIYVSEIRKDGSLGVAKNLGRKVNTEKNDVYPNVVGTNTLFFASEGREGHGGLDVYRTQVGQRKVDLAVNLGSPINSGEDDFAITFIEENGKGYVMSNRGNNKNTLHRVAFTYTDKKKRHKEENDYNTLEAFNTDTEIRYTTSIFEDE